MPRINTRSSTPTATAPFDVARAGAPPPIRWPVLAAVFIGGMLGGLARYGLTVAWPPPPGGFPWATFGINLSGCLLIGVLMAAITDLWPSRTLLRPFWGTGVLGGYTTFSTYIVDAQHLLDHARAGVALIYLAATIGGALIAVFTGHSLARLALRGGREARP
ncbi:fluoride efflux transporter CrcB [Allorhizocola rhizosphaerae]|uniref:fluoride efflux transporter CrcB n=1 Tax=Allorhizocola rhizosphaerae TaxID=1872709 RepID=UPI000E3E64C4|nr:fluoride efflux transporter CrcB [Allorhizocola rhizosphaerae]